MRVQILRGYRGTASNEVFFEAGEHELDAPFAEYLINNGHAIALDEPEQQPEPLPIDDDLNDMTVAELKDYADVNGIILDYSMRKADIIAAIEDAL